MKVTPRIRKRIKANIRNQHIGSRIYLDLNEFS
jgi:hypothetical protein